MGSGVGKARDGLRVKLHFAHRVEVMIGVVGEVHHREALPRTGRERVVEERVGIHALCPSLSRKALLLGWLVVPRLVE